MTTDNVITLPNAIEKERTNRERDPDWWKLLCCLLVDKFVGVGPEVEITQSDVDIARARGDFITVNLDPDPSIKRITIQLHKLTTAEG